LEKPAAYASPLTSYEAILSRTRPSEVNLQPKVVLALVLLLDLDGMHEDEAEDEDD
jgi:hypothetical protein